MLKELADALVTELNSRAWSQSFTAVRRTRPRYTLDELATLRVSIMPRPFESVAYTRGELEQTPVFDVGIQQRIDLPGEASEQDHIDRLTALAEQFVGYFRPPCRLDAYPAAVLVRANLDPLCLPEHLDQHRVFTAVVTLTFKLTA